MQTAALKSRSMLSTQDPMISEDSSLMESHQQSIGEGRPLPGFRRILGLPPPHMGDQHLELVATERSVRRIRPGRRVVEGRPAPAANVDTS